MRDSVHELSSNEALAPLVALLAEALAPRIAAELARNLPPEHPDRNEEPWRLLTLKEAAARLGRSERWVRERVKRGDFPRVRLDGGPLAFELEDIRAFARKRRIDGAS